MSCYIRSRYVENLKYPQYSDYTTWYHLCTPKRQPHLAIEGVFGVSFVSSASELCPTWLQCCVHHRELSDRVNAGFDSIYKVTKHSTPFRFIGIWIYIYIHAYIYMLFHKRFQFRYIVCLTVREVSCHQNVHVNIHFKTQCDMNTSLPYFFQQFDES